MTLSIWITKQSILVTTSDQLEFKVLSGHSANEVRVSGFGEPLITFEKDFMSPSVSKAKRISRAIVRRIFLNPLEGLLLCRLAFWIAVISFLAPYLTLPRALKIVAPSKLKLGSGSDPEAQRVLARTLDLLLSADILMFRPVCWKRAAVLHRFLLLRGVVTRIRFGVRTEVDGKLNGHAWLEANGQPVFENSRPDYVITYTFPSSEQFVQPRSLFAELKRQ